MVKYMPKNDLEEFLINTETDEQKWRIQENYKKKVLIKYSLIFILVFFVFVGLFICDILFLKSVVVGVLAGIAAVVTITVGVLTIKWHYNNLSNKD